MAILALMMSAVVSLASPSVGVWRNEGYGYLLNITESRVQLFERTLSTCLLSGETDREHFVDEIGPTENVTKKDFVLASGSSSIAFRRIEKLPDACQRPFPESKNPLVNFDFLWEFLEENYPFFKARDVDWQAVRREYRPRFAKMEQGTDPWPLLTEILGKFGDPHIHLVDGSRHFQVAKQKSAEEPFSAVHQRLKALLAAPNGPLASQLSEQSFGRVLYGRTRGGHGYISVLTMGGFAHGPDGWPANTSESEDMAAAVSAMNATIAQLSDLPGLILDLRFNPGGSDAISDVIASCFADMKRLAYTKMAKDGSRFGRKFRIYTQSGKCNAYRGPLVVLTGKRTTSAAESLVMRLRVLPNVTILGEATQGAHSDVLSRKMPNGWRVDISNEVYRLADGKIYEATGIPPDLFLPSSDNGPESTNEFGAAIEAADQLLSKQSGTT